MFGDSGSLDSYKHGPSAPTQLKAGQKNQKLGPKFGKLGPGRNQSNPQKIEPHSPTCGPKVNPPFNRRLTIF